MPTYLDGILEAHRARAAADPRPLAEVERALATAPPVRDFVAALTSGGRTMPAVIAEVKRRSPSKGDLAPDLDPASLARDYAAGGASCLSVLTDAPHFGGSPADLRAARGAVELPVLRKDFTVDLRDVLDARAMGADAVLLIVAALSQGELVEFAAAARSLGLAALVEVHDEAELERALEAGASLVGVNQRDLHTFQVDTSRALRVGKAIPEGVLKVAESGIRNADELRELADGGFDAVLVGEALVTSGQPRRALRALRGEPDGS